MFFAREIIDRYKKVCDWYASHIPLNPRGSLVLNRVLTEAVYNGILYPVTIQGIVGRMIENVTQFQNGKGLVL